MYKKPENQVFRVLARFAFGVLFGAAFLVSFQVFRQTNWVIGGLLVMVLFGGMFVLLGASKKTQPVVAPTINRASLALALKEAVEKANVDPSTGKISVEVIDVATALKNHYVGEES